MDSNSLSKYEEYLVNSCNSIELVHKHLKGGEPKLCKVNKEKNNLPEPHKTVASLIRVGKENATLLSDIISIAELKDRRSAHLVIEQLINNYGYVIGASRTGTYKGYYMPANEKEFQEIVKTFKTTINSMNERYKNLLNNYSKDSPKSDTA